MELHIINKDLKDYFGAGKEVIPEKPKVADHIKKILDKLNLPSQVLDVQTGPLVTTYTVRPERLIPIGRYLQNNTERDLAFYLGVQSVRCTQTTEGTIQIEVANLNRGSVALNMVYSGETTYPPLAFPFGLGANNTSIWGTLKSMPHLLIAGTTGSGKSVLMHNILLAMHITATPDELRLVLIDPKRVEFAGYKNSPFLVEKGKIYDKAEGRLALEKLEYVMRERYTLMQDEGVRNIDKLNEKGWNLPYIVGVIDEVADFFTDKTHGEASQELVMSIAQLGRAAGIHLILATQRPSRDVITGTVKANFPARAVLRTATAIDSRVVMESNGAEKLLGNGDAIFRIPGFDDRRVSVPYVGEDDVELAVDVWATVSNVYSDSHEFAFAKTQADQCRLEEEDYENKITDKAGDDPETLKKKMMTRLMTEHGIIPKGVTLG